MQQIVISKILILGLLLGCQDGARKSSADPSVAIEVQPSVSVVERAASVVARAQIKAVPVTPLPAGTIRGMALPPYAEFPELSYEAMLDRLLTIGTTHVSIIVNWEQNTIYDNRIQARSFGVPDDNRIRKLIQHAHTNGLKVMLFPILHVNRRSDGEWRGRLDPRDLGRWQNDYRNFILHYARLANQESVEIFSVGSELSSMEKHTDYWKGLIAQVRTEFAGKMIYSSNWDHFHHPEFWEDLDYIGVSAYFEVSTDSKQAIHKVTQTWEARRSELLEFARSKERPLILTEVGYPSVDSAAVKPWDYTSKSGPNSLQQLAAYRSLVDAWVTPSADFGGVFIWHGWGRGGELDTSYSFWDKPSQQLVKSWFSASPSTYP